MAHKALNVDERAKKILHNLSKEDKSRNFEERGRRRELHEQMVHRLNDKLRSDRNEVTEEDLQELQAVVVASKDVFQKIENSVDGKELCLDAQLQVALTSALFKNVSIAKTSKTKKQFSGATLARRMKIYAGVELDKEARTAKKAADEAPSGFYVLEKEDFDVEPDDADYPLEYEGMKKPQWAMIGRRLGAFLHCGPQVSFLSPMFNPRDIVEAKLKKEKKERQAKQEAKVKAEAVVLKVKDEGEHAADEMAVSKELDIARKTLRRALRRNDGALNYYRFVIDPADFGRTVENMFHVSFLVKDGAARFDIGEDGMPCLFELNEEERELLKDAEGLGENTCQAILPFNMKLWKGFIDTLNITQAMIAPSS